MECPLVSVVIPAYNRPHTLKIAIDSVLEQTYPNIEIIICDDSTTNEVQEMLKDSYLDSFSQIKYYKNEKNLFLGNWHKCFDLASGEYINYLMDDDIFHKEKIARMIYFLKNSKTSHWLPRIGKPLMNPGLFSRRSMQRKNYTKKQGSWTEECWQTLH
ncbi:glycosyltransferase family 2 protein [Paenibacillus farraposensis]|uniref:glycosyltransferase family 2 protein n=1 Tax=Paenibacillus farraposensis TaxID=2807095 RepID=UPI003620FB42